jgi:transcriptional regulator with XRE-family HTH domain
MERIGERIKRKREQQSMQLNDLARKVGISSSALSQIERAKAYPSIITLKLIAENLQTTVGELIGENESAGNNTVFRNEENLLVCDNESGTAMFLLSQSNLNKQVDSFLLKFEKKSSSDDIFKTISGYIYGYLITGEIQFEIDSKSYVIQPGDSIYFSTKRNFRFENLFDGPSELLCILPNSYR